MMSCSAPGQSESQLSPNEFKLFFKWIVAIQGPELDLPGRQVRLGVSADDVSYDFLGGGQYLRRGTQANPTQERIHRNQIFAINHFVLRSVD